MQTKWTRLTDNQWELMKDYVDWQRKRSLSLRETLDAIFYIVRTGTQWRNLPQDMFPDWQAVYYYFDKWKRNGAIKKMNAAFNRLERELKGHEATATLALADSQSIKLAPMIYEHRGIDGNKKVNGRKRHILVDVKGRIYDTHIHATNLHDSPEGVELLKESSFDMEVLQTVMADKTYRGTFAKAVEKLDLNFEVPARPDNTKGFVVEAKRWVVERTFAWLNFYRRCVIDYEHTPESASLFLIFANLSMVIEQIGT